MDFNIVIPIITAIIGFFAGTVPSYISFRSKKMELEYSYNKSKEERLYESSRQYIEILYKPIYRILISLENEIFKNEQVQSDLYNPLCLAITHIDKIRNGDNIIFLTKNIETELFQLYKFLMMSVNNKNYTFGIKTNYRLFGVFTTFYDTEIFSDEKSARRSLHVKNFTNLFSQSLLFNNLFSVNSELIYKSADIKSTIFKEQLEKHINTIKSELKQIVLDDDN